MSENTQEKMERLEAAATYYGFTPSEKKMSAAFLKIMLEEGEVDLEKHPELLDLMQEVEADEDVPPFGGVVSNEDGNVIGLRRKTQDGRWKELIPEDGKLIIPIMEEGC